MILKGVALHKSGQDQLMKEKLNMRSKYIIFQLFKNNIITLSHILFRNNDDNEKYNNNNENKNKKTSRV